MDHQILPPRRFKPIIHSLSILSLLSLLLILHISFLSHSHPHPTIQSFSTGAIAAAPDNCDYSAGQWVPSSTFSLYNGTTCTTIKASQNCIANGRPDRNYLHWKWKPHSCPLPPFEGAAFLHLLRRRHLAFVGDSIARNQLESLLCLLSTVHPPDLVHSSGDGKNRRWRFRRHSAIISIRWSPFLVRGVEKSTESGLDHNELYLDEADQNWAKEIHSFDWIIFSIGHWFLHPAVYYQDGGRTVLGCHYCPKLNLTEVGFFDPFRKSLRRALSEVAEAGKRAVVTTFSPAHFEGEWDKLGACSKTEPERERKMEWMDGELRKIGREEAGRSGAQVLDVTEMANQRPDGHPGAYMNEFPLEGGEKEKRVQNDCVHWCLPGPIDAWNELLFQLLRRSYPDRQIGIGR